MKQERPAKTLAWMATGAVMLAAGAFLGSAAARRKDRSPARGSEPGADDGSLEDLADRPLAREVLAESMAAARRVDSLADAVASMDTRLQAMERASSTDRLEAIWQRLQQIEQRLEQVQTERLEVPAIDALLSQAESRFTPRIVSLENRVEEHHEAIRQLQTHASQTEANLQKMLAAVEKLTDQLSRAMPAGSLRIEPRRETVAATPDAAAPAGVAAAGSEPAEAAGESPEGTGKSSGPFRWKAMALAGAITIGLVGSSSAVRNTRVFEPRTAAAAVPVSGASDQIDTAIASLSRLAEQQPEDQMWKYELGRLCAMKHDWAQAERWYRAVLKDNPHDPRALYSLADVMNHRAVRR